MFLWSRTLQPAYLYVQMSIDLVCKGNDDTLSIFLKEKVILICLNKQVMKLNMLLACICQDITETKHTQKKV